LTILKLNTIVTLVEPSDKTANWTGNGSASWRGNMAQTVGANFDDRKAIGWALK